MNTPQTTTTITAMEHAAAMADYSRSGEHRACSLNNRGPIKFENNGKLDGKVLEAYGRTGFYVFENVIGKDELVELLTDVQLFLDRTPTVPGAQFDQNGKPAMGLNFCSADVFLVESVKRSIGRDRPEQGTPSHKGVGPEASSR